MVPQYLSLYVLSIPDIHLHNSQLGSKVDWRTHQLIEQDTINHRNCHVPIVSLHELGFQMENYANFRRLWEPLLSSISAWRTNEGFCTTFLQILFRDQFLQKNATFGLLYSKQQFQSRQLLPLSDRMGRCGRPLKIEWSYEGEHFFLCLRRSFQKLSRNCRTQAYNLPAGPVKKTFFPDLTRS